MMAPVAVIGQAVGAAALPTLARLHSEGRSAELDRMMLRTLQATVAVAALAAAALFVVAEPFVAAMYRRGAFDDAATARVSALLALLSFAVPGWVVQQVAIRSFFARAEMWRPMLLGTGMALAAIPLYYGLGQVHGAEGLAVAGALAISGNALATVVWSSLRFGGPDLGALLSTTLRSAVIAATGGLVATALLPGGAGLMGALVDLLVAGGVLLAVAAVGVWLIGDAVMRQTGERLLVRAQLDRVFSRFFR